MWLVYLGYDDELPVACGKIGRPTFYKVWQFRFSNPVKVC
jgi:hypothetical protein